MDYPLNTNHLEEVRKYLNYFENKRKESSKEVEILFTQFISEKIKDDILSRAEVEGLISELRDEVKISLDSELSTIVSMSGVYMKILMLQAEAKNFFLQGDVSFIENEKAIEEMKNLSFEKEFTRKNQAGKLPTMQSSIASDLNTVSKIKELTEERDALKKKLMETQHKLSSVTDDMNKYKNLCENTEKVAAHESEIKEALEETKVIAK